MPLNPFAPFPGAFGNLSVRSAGRAANPRSAISGLSPILAGVRAAGVPRTGGDATQSAFAKNDVPMLWLSLIAKFGRDVDFWPEGNAGQALTVAIVWIEGVEGEETSPGRYSHAHIRHADIGRAPTLRDLVCHLDEIYDVMAINALPYGCSTMILQSRKEAF